MAAGAVRSLGIAGATAQVLVRLAIGLALLVGGTAALYFSTQNDLLRSYNAAPQCAALADALAGNNCRYTATAMVTEISKDTGGVAVYFDLPGSYGPFFRARLPVGVQPDSSLKQGDPVQVEFWSFRVTRFGGVVTADNPVNDPRSGNLLAIGIVLVPLGLAATGWAVVTARNVRRRAEMEPTAAKMNPVAISDALWR